MNSRPICGKTIFLAGPTAVGKSEVALAWAEELGGEIISVDSMQVYCGLDIGSAKPSTAERARVRHHLIDILPLQESFSAARFVTLARPAAADILARGRVPIFCGGTGLYFKAYLEGLGGASPPDPGLRAAVEGSTMAELLVELQARDPGTYESIDRQNPRRVRRAVEVMRSSGKPLAEQRSPWAPVRQGGSNSAPETSPYGGQFYVVTRSAEDLRRRIDERVERMFRAGLVEETEALLQRGLAANRTAMQAIGYRQVVEHLQGVRSFAETIALVKQRTRQFAKRQMTWFRWQTTNARWLSLAPGQRTVNPELLGATN